MGDNLTVGQLQRKANRKAPVLRILRGRVDCHVTAAEMETSRQKPSVGRRFGGQMATNLTSLTLPGKPDNVN
jgi:hypothetical protein